MLKQISRHFLASNGPSPSLDSHKTQPQLVIRGQQLTVRGRLGPTVSAERCASPRPEICPTEYTQLNYDNDACPQETDNQIYSKSRRQALMPCLIRTILNDVPTRDASIWFWPYYLCNFSSLHGRTATQFDPHLTSLITITPYTVNSVMLKLS